jgi:hypothetical protein
LHGDFLAAQAGNVAVAAVERQAGLLRGDLDSPGGQELANWLEPVTGQDDQVAGKR